LLADALKRATIHGSVTNRELLVRILRHPEFLAGATDTHFLDRNDPSELGAPLVDAEGEAAAMLAAALAAQTERAVARPVMASIPSGWRNNPSTLNETVFTTPTGERRVGYRFDARTGLIAAVDGSPLEAVALVDAGPDRVGIEIDGLLSWFSVRRSSLVHHVDGPHGYVRLVEHPRFPEVGTEDEPGSLHAPMPGKVIQVRVLDGDHVEEGDTLVVMEAMKMEHTLRAPFAGVVHSMRVQPGDQVDAEQVLVVVEESER
jgi:propionyl-CoA carboxylase alpha chain